MHKAQHAKLVVGLAVAGLVSAGLVGVASASGGADGAPDGFQPVTSSWTSADTGYVFGWAPCDEGFCEAFVTTDDGGQTWTELAAPDLGQPDEYQTPELLVTEQKGKTTGVLVMHEKEAYSTTNGGQSWQANDFGLDYESNEYWWVDSMTATPNYVYMLGGGYDDFGDQWAEFVRTPIGETAWETVPDVSVELGDGDVSARGNTGVVSLRKPYVTEDGETRSEIQSPCQDPPQRWTSGGQGRIYQACDKNALGFRLHASTDNGASFTNGAEIQGRAEVSDLAAVGETVAVGTDSCGIHTSTDGGATVRTTLPEDPQAASWEIANLQLSNDGTGTAICRFAGYGTDERGTLYRTTDGGQSWVPVTFD